MIIHVKKKHIRKGKRGSMTWCPIAIAMNEQIPHTHRIKISCLHAYQTCGKEALGPSISSIVLPVSVQKRIARFDLEGKMEPFNFRIRSNGNWTRWP